MCRKPLIVDAGKLVTEMQAKPMYVYRNEENEER